MKRFMPTVSVGIPAYNEENNIASLLASVLHQKQNNYTLKEVIVVSDGSSDRTVESVKSLGDKRIVIKNDGKRKGKSARLNEIFSFFKGDILILLDADILIKNSALFDTLIRSTELPKSGIASPNYEALPAKSFFGKCLQVSLDVQVDLRKKWHNGKNYLSFKGACIAMDGVFARSISLPEKLVNNDGYLYFKALEKGYTPKYVSGVYVYYKTPSHFTDHLAQSSRYQASKDELSEFVTTPKDEYHIPVLLYMTASLKYLFRKPVYFIGYLVIRMATKLFRQKKVTAKWQIASSTK